MVCHSCGQKIETSHGVRRTDVCPHCGSDVHCCLNCINYDTSKYNSCAEPSAEWVSDKSAANFCDFFEPSTRVPVLSNSRSSIQEARKAFDALFKKE